MYLSFIIYHQRIRPEIAILRYPGSPFQSCAGALMAYPARKRLSPQIRKSGGSVDGSVWGPCWWLQKVSCSLLFDFFDLLC